MKRRVFLVQASVLDDSPRLIKEVDLLEQNGYSITLLGWDRTGKTLLMPRKMSCSLSEITLRTKAPQGIRVLPFLLAWWFFELLWLIRADFDCVHAINFDSIIPAVIAGRLKNKPIIYEVLDTQTDFAFFPRIVRWVGIRIDKFLMKLVDAVVLVDEMQIEEFGGIPSSDVVVAYDSPPDFFEIMNVEYYNKGNEPFTIFYVGKLSAARRLNLDRIFTAASEIDDVKIVIAGYGDLTEEIEDWAHKMPEKMVFIGRISYSEALERSFESDLLFSIRDPLMPTHKYICGCKMLEAMMCAKPILVGNGTSTADKVSRANCGILVDGNNIEEIRKAIITLKESKVICNQLGRNGRRAYETIYGWEIMKRRLSDLYFKVLNKDRSSHNEF